MERSNKSQGFTHRHDKEWKIVAAEWSGDTWKRTAECWWVKLNKEETELRSIIVSRVVAAGTWDYMRRGGDAPDKYWIECARIMRAEHQNLSRIRFEFHSPVLLVFSFTFLSNILLPFPIIIRLWKFLHIFFFYECIHQRAGANNAEWKKELESTHVFFSFFRSFPFTPQQISVISKFELFFTWLFSSWFDDKRARLSRHRTQHTRRPGGSEDYPFFFTLTVMFSLLFS